MYMELERDGSITYTGEKESVRTVCVHRIWYVCLVDNGREMFSTSFRKESVRVRYNKLT